MKKLFFGLALALAAVAAMAAVHQEKIGDLYYNLDDSTMTAEVASDSSSYYSLTTVEIPESVTCDDKSYAVTTIGSGAFGGAFSLKSVSAPFVTTIGGGAFDSCSQMESVYAPFVTAIGSSAFSVCRSLALLTVNSAMKKDWESKKSGYGIPSDINPTVAFHVMTWANLTNEVATAESGAEIAVRADITEPTGELAVPKGKAVTIKLCGKTVSCARVTVGGALTVGDAEDSVGRIVASDGAKVGKGGSVTLLGGPMRGTFTARSPGLILFLKSSDAK